MRIRLGTATLLAAVLFAAGCDSSDDDDSGGDMTGNPDGTPMEGAPSGDVFDIAARDADSDSVRLDVPALRAQLDALVGDGDSLEPLSLEDGDTATTALQRRQQAQGM